MPPKYNLNAKTITAPLAAFCMAGILFVYTRTSIKAAKRNAQQHREADGGQINWQNENLRRHGQLESPVEQNTFGQLVGMARESTKGGRGAREQGGKEDGMEVKETDAERLLKIRARNGKSS